jgi:Amt family ammonium transporter
MEIKTIAEFVESAQVLPILESIGVQYAQGFHVGLEIPIGELSANALKLKSESRTTDT